MVAKSVVRSKQGLLPTLPMPKGLPKIQLTDNARQVLERRYVRRGDDGQPAEALDEERGGADQPRGGDRPRTAHGHRQARRGDGGRPAAWRLDFYGGGTLWRRRGAGRRPSLPAPLTRSGRWRGGSGRRSDQPMRRCAASSYFSEVPGTIAARISAAGSCCTETGVAARSSRGRTAAGQRAGALTSAPARGTGNRPASPAGTSPAPTRTPGIR